MKLLVLAFTCLISVAYADFDESTNFQPGLNYFEEANSLTDLFGSKGSQLCAPKAISHAMAFLKRSFPQILAVPDLDKDGISDTVKDKIRYFFGTCQSDRETGTYYHQAIMCMKEFLVASNLGAWSFMIGPHALEAPPGHQIEAVRRAVTLTDIRYYLGKRAAVIMGVGWYRFKAQIQKYEREGGHYVNVYGHDYNHAWDQSKIILKVNNPWVNYKERPEAAMFDDVTMTQMTGSFEEQYPSGLNYELNGLGFVFNGIKAIVEDLFIMYPVPN